MTHPNAILESNSSLRTTEPPAQPVQHSTIKKKYELSNVELKCLEALNKQLMNLAELQAYSGACQASENFADEQKSLYKFVKRSKYFANEKIAAVNAVSILNLMGYSFSHKNLKKVRIPGAFLERANLVGSDLREADLTGVTLTGAAFSNALFEGARMEGIKL